MTRSNRTLNRVLLALVGILLLAAAAWILVPLVSDVRLPAIPVPTQTALWIGLGGLVVIIILALAWIATRGHGRISHLLRLRSADGDLTIDASLVGDLVADALHGNPDVVSVSSTGFRIRGASVLSLRVAARRGTDLTRAIDAVETAIADLDIVLEQRVPVVLHLASGGSTVRVT